MSPARNARREHARLRPAALVELPNPDISEADRRAAITVRLQLYWRCIVFLVERGAVYSVRPFNSK
jgi:hypothetical protein